MLIDHFSFLACIYIPSPVSSIYSNASALGGEPTSPGMFMGTEVNRNEYLPTFAQY